MKNLLFYLFLFFTISFMSSCGKEDQGYENKSKTVIVVKASIPEFVFGFGTKQYAYCPTVLLQKDGSRHIFFCGNPTNGIMVDNIYHISESEANISSAPKSVLQPSLSWDSHHTCDPNVIEGEFTYDSQTYKYAMFYLSNPLNFYYNEIGVAFSNDLNSNTWTKYHRQLIEKTWSGEDEQYLGGGTRSWGVGQPSAISIDKKGKVMLTYTIGDINGTRVVWRICDLSDMSDPILGSVNTVSLTGLTDMQNRPEPYLCNTDFALDIKNDKLVMVRPVHPHEDTYPNFLPSAIEINYISYKDFLNNEGRWETLYRIRNVESRYPRNHNACIMRDNFGYIGKWDNPTCYFTVSDATPNVSYVNGNYAEWTYNIYKTTIYKKEINVD